MKPHLTNYLRTGFYLFFMALAAGIYFLETNHYAYNQALIVGTAATAIIVTCCIYEVLSSQIPKSEKIMWTLLLLVLNMVACLLYYFIRRKKIATAQA